MPLPTFISFLVPLWFGGNDTKRRKWGRPDRGRKRNFDFLVASCARANNLGPIIKVKCREMLRGVEEKEGGRRKRERRGEERRGEERRGEERRKRSTQGWVNCAKERRRFWKLVIAWAWFDDGGAVELGGGSHGQHITVHAFPGEEQDWLSRVEEHCRGVEGHHDSQRTESLQSIQRTESLLSIRGVDLIAEIMADSLVKNSSMPVTRSNLFDFRVGVF